MKKNLFSWLIYDAANSFLTVSLGSLFLAQWVVLDNGFDDIWYGGTLALSTIVLLITSPFWGAWSDRLGKRLPFLRATTTVLLICHGLLALSVVSPMRSTAKVVVALVLACILQYLYQVSLIFYNALLDIISSKTTRGVVSGLGEAVSNLGWIGATGILILFSTGKINLWGTPGRQQVFLPAFIFFFLLSLPMYIWLKEPERRSLYRTKLNLRQVYNSTLAGIEDMFKNNRNVAWFLIAFSLISDCILTIQTYFAILMDAIYKIPDTQKFLVTLIMFIPMIIGNYVLGRFGDMRGHKRIMLWSCFGVSVLMTILALSSSPTVLYVLTAFLGIGWGGFYVASRALLIKIAPKDKLAEYFGFYSSFYRFASIIGPLIWGITTLILKNYGVLKYRAAGIAVILLMIVGIFILTKVKEEKTYV